MQKIKNILKDYQLLLDNVPALVTVAFCVGTVLMNISAAKVLVNVWSVAITGGFWLSWLPFLCLDVVSKRFGARAAIMLNILSAACNIFSVVFLAFIAAIPTKDDYTAFNTICGGVWFISLSSIVAFILSGIVNSIVNSSIGRLFNNKTSAVEFATRSFISTFVGQAVDNFVFIWLSYVIFAPRIWGLTPIPLTACIGTAILGGVIELLCEVVLSPLGYIIVRRWERDDVGRAYLDIHPIN